MTSRRWHTPGNRHPDGGPRLRALIDRIAEQQRYVPPPPRYRLLVSLLEIRDDMHDFCTLHNISIHDAPCLQVMFVGEKTDLQLFIRCFFPQEQHAVCLNSLYLA